MREHEHDPEVLRQVERLERRAVAGAELRPLGEEEGDVGAEARGERVQLVRRQRLGERLVREPEGRRGVGAAAAEAGGDGTRFSISARQCGSTPARAASAWSAPRTSVSSGKPATRSASAGSSSIRSESESRW